ncbi:hypothetical protein BDC45DRAFT_505261 [Circinella umbellata]|nr:hypothetical protein BDC45DRAFT_505261 [Circinella umbellata]
MLLKEITCRQARIRNLEYQLKEIRNEYNELYKEHCETEYRLQFIEKHGIWVSAEEHDTISHYRHWIYHQLSQKESQVKQLQQKIDQEVFNIQNEYHQSLSISNNNIKSSSSLPPQKQHYSSFHILLQNNQSIRWQEYLNQIVYLRSSNRRKFTDMFLHSSTSSSLLLNNNKRIKRHNNNNNNKRNK